MDGAASGLVAYEIAQQLHAQGQEVALLVLFDTFNRLVRPDQLSKRIWFHLRSMTQLKSGDVPIYLLGRVKALWFILTRLMRLPRVAAKFIPPVGLQYRPKPYSGRVLLFRSNLWPTSWYMDEKLGWDGLIIGEGRLSRLRQCIHTEMHRLKYLI